MSRPPKNLETENTKRGKLRRPKFLPVDHIKEVSRLGKKDNGEKEKCMESCKDVVGFLLIVFLLALVSFSLLRRLLNSNIIHYISPQYHYSLFSHHFFLSNF